MTLDNNTILKIAHKLELDEAPIVLVFGRLCSGKGTYAQSFYNHEHVVVSGVVRSLVNSNTRDELQTTAHLDSEIAKELEVSISELLKQNKRVIVDGIRQQSIVQMLEKAFCNIEYVWLDVDKDVLRERYKSRADKKDTADFDVAYDADELLGVAELEEYLKTKHSLRIIKH